MVYCRVSIVSVRLHCTIFVNKLWVPHNDQAGQSNLCEYKKKLGSGKLMMIRIRQTDEDPDPAN